jgi:hypothetical protein
MQWAILLPVACIVGAASIMDAQQTTPAVLPANWKVSVERCVFIRCGTRVEADGSRLPVGPRGDVAGARGVMVRSPNGFGLVKTDPPRFAQNETLPLAFTGFTMAGDYSGTLRVWIGKDSTDLVMAVRVHDSWLNASVLILAGVLLALCAQSYTTVLRSATLLEARALELKPAATAAADAFRSRLQKAQSDYAASLARYSIVDDIANVSDVLVEDAQGFRRTRFTALTLENARYKATIELLERAEATVRDWPTFADDLTALAAAAKGLTTNPGIARPAGDDATAPRIMRDVSALLEGNSLSLDIVASLRKAVTAHVAMLAQWRKWATRLEEQQVLADALSTLPEGLSVDEKAKLGEARNLLDAVRVALWERDSIDRLNAANVDGDLDRVANALAPLRRAIPGGGMESAAAEPVAPVQTTTSLAPRSAADMRRRIANVDFAWLVVTVLVALVAGLQTVYFDKPFGTLEDYLTAFTTGFATRAGLDLLATAVRLFDHRLSASAS